MKLTGHNAELFNVFSRVARKAFKNTHLLSCSVLSKAPNYGNILERYSKKESLAFPSFPQQVFLFLRYVAANIGHFIFLVMARFFWSLGKHQRLSSYFSKEKPLLTIDIFALLPRIATEGNVEDYYLHGLAEQAEKGGFSSLYLYRMYGSRSPKTVYQAIKCIQSSGKGIPDVCLLSFADWFVLFFHLFAYLPAHRALLCSMKKHIAEKKKHIVETKNTQGSLPEEYILQALYDTMGENIMAGELSRLAGRRLAEKLSGHKHAIVVSWYENQTVNKAFYSGVNAYRKTLLSSGRSSSTQFIGAQLLIWPEELLNNHPDDAEIALGIVPDTVVVNGSWFLPEQSRQRYVVGPALRYKKIFSFGASLEEKNKTHQVLEEKSTSLSMKKNSSLLPSIREKTSNLLAEEKKDHDILLSEENSKHLVGEEKGKTSSLNEENTRCSYRQKNSSTPLQEEAHSHPQQLKKDNRNLSLCKKNGYIQQGKEESETLQSVEEKNKNTPDKQYTYEGNQHASLLERSKDIKPVLVLLSYHPEETKRVLQLVLPLAEKGYALCYKFHPATSPKEYLAFLPKDPVFAEKDLYTALQRSSAVIGSGSGTLAEAVAIGIPALTVEKSGELCLNYLPAFGQGILWEKVENESDVEPLLAQLAKQKNRESYAKYVHEFTSLLFAEPTEERIIQAFALRE